LIARTFNKLYANTERNKSLNIPETLISIFLLDCIDVGAYPRIASLTNPSKKMSKSANEKTIFLTTPPSEIETLISRALTDSLPGITASPDRPGFTNLLNISAAFENISVEELERKVSGWRVKEFKEYVAHTIIKGLEPIQKRYAEVKGDTAWLEKVRRHGNQRARRVAVERMEMIKSLVGLSQTGSIRADKEEII
jgi:tryptophanyl-tRNA synthetase